MRTKASSDLAFFGVYHDEGFDRIHTLLRAVRPVFEIVVVALQAPTDAEMDATEGLTDALIVHERLGIGDASYPDALKVAKAAGARWVMMLDGDEMPDPALLDSIPQAFADREIRDVGAARFTRRNLFLRADGFVVPGFVEKTPRMYRISTIKDWTGVPHVDQHTTDREPVWWTVGEIMHTRFISEILPDSLRYAHMSIGANDFASFQHTTQHLARVYANLTRYLGIRTARAELLGGMLRAEQQAGSKLLEFSAQLDRSQLEQRWKELADA